jgi:hypothetical protein
MIFRSFDFSVLIVSSLLAAAGSDTLPTHAERIDSVLQQRYDAEGITPLPLCDDLTFLRRVSLDLLGRIPTAEEVSQFELHPDRAGTIDTMLESDEFESFLSEVWTGWLLGYSNAFQTDRELFRIWMEREIANDVNFQEMTRKMITADGSVAAEGQVNFLARHRYNPAVTVSRSFLGVRLECAQCHDHPFDRWTQDDYQKMTRFFSTMRFSDRDGTIMLQDANANNRPENRPRFLTGSVALTNRYRQELALYVTSCKPFGRTFANRVWYQLMGRGIIDPPDDHNQENPPCDRNLLNNVTEIAVTEDFQIRPLFRAICNTAAYQRQSANSTTSAEAINLFAARQIKPLLPEQYVDSLLTATEQSIDSRRRRQMIRRAVGQQNLNEDFQRTWDYRETVQQLMEKTNVEIGKQANQSARKEPLEELYLRILTRRPTPKEKMTCRDHDKTDVAFALLFGNEFFFNH